METTKPNSNYLILESTSCESTKDWFAWNNLMPPGPATFHVVGQVQVPNPGVVAYLQYKTPQGINPQILLLDLVLVQQPGIWPQVISWAEARYDRVGIELKYSNVNIFCDGELIQDIKVEDIH